MFESKDAYYKTIGFRENEGKIENVDDYLKRIESYMKLYGALVQVCHLIFECDAFIHVLNNSYNNLGATIISTPSF